VFCVFLFSTPASHSPLVLFGHSALHPRAVGVPLESALNLVSPMSPCGAHDARHVDVCHTDMWNVNVKCMLY